MSFRLIDGNWHGELVRARRQHPGDLQIVSPFVQAGALLQLLRGQPPTQVMLITRYYLADFADRVSDLQALRLLVDGGGAVRGIRNLHAKLYLFGGAEAIMTSANLTGAALHRNIEFGFASDDVPVLASCRAFFDALWRQAGPDLTLQEVDSWHAQVQTRLAEGGRPRGGADLPDYGANIGLPEPQKSLPAAFIEPPQAFVKMLGDSATRVPLSHPVIEELHSSGCHWAVCYPLDRRPRAPKDGAVMLMGRLTRDPDDIRIFGRAIGIEYQEGRDDATEADIAFQKGDHKRDWKLKWPHYVRVSNAKFVAGSMKNGVSLRDLMRDLGHACFASTQRNHNDMKGNTNPRFALRQQPAVELTPEGYAWLIQRLENAFDQHGSISAAEMAQLDWPDVPVNWAQSPSHWGAGSKLRAMSEAWRAGP